MSFLSKHLVGEGTIFILLNKNIEERKAPMDFLFHSELNGGGLIVKVFEEEIQLIFAMRLDDICVIYKSLP